MPMKNNEDEVVPVGQSLFYSWRSAPGASILPSAARCATDAPEALKGENAQKVRMPRRSQKSSKVLPIARQVAETTRK